MASKKKPVAIEKAPDVVEGLKVAAIWVPVAKLMPWTENPRKNDKAVEKVANSIKRFGFGAPLIARLDNGELIAGHTRLRAAKQLGLEQVPVRYMDLDAADAHLLALADNKLNEVAEWDTQRLIEELGKHQADDSLIAGFGPEELDKLAGGWGKPEVHEDDIPDVPTVARGVRGDVWLLGEHRVMCGDSTDAADLARLMNAQTAVCMWTDPPYGVSYVGKTKKALTIENDGAENLPEFIAKAFTACDLHLGEGCPIYVAHPAGPLSLAFGAAFVGAGWRFHETLVWMKNSMVLGHSDYHYKHEPIIYGWKGKNRHWYAGRDQTTILEHDRPSRSTEHPTAKPVSLIAQCLNNSTRPGDLVLEPFGGSGSTLAACQQLGRRCYTMELSPVYVDVIVKRWEALTGQTAHCEELRRSA